MSVFGRLSRRLAQQGIQFQSYRMRHTGITAWARSAVSAPVLQQLAGHKSIVTTQNYIGRLSRDDLSRVPSAFTRVFGRAV